MINCLQNFFSSTSGWDGFLTAIALLLTYFLILGLVAITIYSIVFSFSSAWHEGKKL
jgi:hypothetical protein